MSLDIIRPTRAAHLRRIFKVLTVSLACGVATTTTWAQQPGRPTTPALPDTAIEVPTAEGPIRVAVVTKGLEHPWGLAFLPDGSVLVTERSGQVRLIRDGMLDPTPIAGVPAVHAVRLSGLLDIALHPNFMQNQLVYITYTKKIQQDPLEIATTLARGRLEGHAFVDMRDILSADPWPGNGGSASRITFGRDGLLYMTTGASNGAFAQDPASLRGKTLRLTDDGSPAPGNPFAGQDGYRPEIYSMGHRNALGLAVNPLTNEVWNSEMGPNGGDEVNIVRPGKNYGWPNFSYGRTYEGPEVSEVPWGDGIELPWAHWVPGISPSGLSFYTGDRYFPAWKNSVFIGALRMGQIAGTGHLSRIQFDEQGHERRRELLLLSLGQRIRDVRQGPDGFLYVLTDETDGALLRLEPAP